MRTETVHTLILGAGPAGLASGYTLAKAGLRLVILERDSVPGGLMRSIHHGDFVVDIGRKELYNRLAKVDDFWEGIIGSDYRPYPHRGGYLYERHILEMSPSHRGFRRGMPWTMFLACICGFFWSRLHIFAPSPRNVEEYFYRTRGRLLTRVASQGFQEKLTGRSWASIPLPKNFSNGDAGLLPTMKDAIRRVWSNREVNTYKGVWRHPAKGTGQICDALARAIADCGGSFAYRVKILEIKATVPFLEAVVVEIDGQRTCYQVTNLISSIPPEVLIPMLGHKLPDAYSDAAVEPSARRTVLLVYLFMNCPPRFPHAWLQVTDQTTRIGRITNYSGFNADMVPVGKGALCCEYYCFGADPLLEKRPAELIRQTIDYCISAGLIDHNSVADTLVLKFHGADASQNRHNWITSLRLGLLDQLVPYKNLYHVGRTDLDIATLAGLESAEAILTGDRTTFDKHVDPIQLGIRSEKKAFEFKVPVS